MGRMRYLEDKDGNEAKVTAALDALKVHMIDPAGTTFEDLETTLDAIETLLGGTQKTKLWDGTETLDLLKRTQKFDDNTPTIPISGRSVTANTAVSLPVAIYSDADSAKGTFVIPVTPMTSERLEGTKITDGVDTLALVPHYSAQDASCVGIALMGYRQAIAKYTRIPTAIHSDSTTAKGAEIIPVTPMTGGREEGVFTRGFIPETPLAETKAGVSIPNTTWTTLKTITVAADTTLWVTDLSATDISAATGTEFLCYLDINGSIVVNTRTPAGESLKLSFNTPYKVATGIVVQIKIYQWSGGALDFDGNLHGFYTTDSELD